MATVNAREINLWIDNDEGLYRWWKSSRQPKVKFIKENRAELVARISRVLGGSRPAHYLVYGE